MRIGSHRPVKTLSFLSAFPFSILLAVCIIGGCATKQSAVHPRHPQFLVDVGIFSGSPDDDAEFKSLMSRNKLASEIRGSPIYHIILVPASNAVLVCNLLSTNDLTARGKIRIYTNAFGPPDFLVSVGWISGSLDDLKELISIMKTNDLGGGTEGSLRYDILVSASKADLACKILSTNDLTLRGRVRLYSSYRDQDKLIRETARIYRPSDIRAVVMPLFSRYLYTGATEPAVPESEIPRTVRKLSIFSEDPDLIKIWVTDNADAIYFLTGNGYGNRWGIVVSRSQNSQEFDGRPGYEYWGDGIYFYKQQ
jgi:hypothetical protein